MKQEVRKEPLSRECAVKHGLLQVRSSSTVFEQATNRTAKTKQRQQIIVRGQHREGHAQALMVQYGIRPVIANSIAVS